MSPASLLVSFIVVCTCIETHASYYYYSDETFRAAKTKKPESVKPYFDKNPSGSIVRSVRINSQGEWHPDGFHMCGKDKYVFAMSLMIDSSYSPDKRGLVGVRMYCGNFTARFFEVNKKRYPKDFSMIESTVSRRDFSFGAEINCHSPIVGFQTRDSQNQGSFDGTGTNNMRLVCSSGHTLEGDGKEQGTWTQPIRRCNPEQAVCGLRTQVDDIVVYHATTQEEKYKAKPSLVSGNDPTGLNNVDVVCCPIDNPLLTCNPSDHFDQIFSCVNLNYTKPLTCNYNFRYGVNTGRTLTKGNRQDQAMNGGLGFTVGANIWIFQKSLTTNVGWSKTTGYNWGESSNEMWTEETSYSLTIMANPGRRVTLYQPVANCGFLSAKANSYFAKEFDVHDKSRSHDDTDIGPVCPDEFVHIRIDRPER